jgi:1,4-alpha-glucan branching enzyme
MSTHAPAANPFLTDYDLYLFGEGSYDRLYEKMGAHLVTVDGRTGVRFAVWAPNAQRVSVIGDFNGWTPGRHVLEPRGSSGIWEGFVPGLGQGAIYKYRIESHHRGFVAEKADPFAFHAETRPKSGSIVWDIGNYDWGDAWWMGERRRAHGLDAPISIYEVHLGSWMRVPEDGMRWLSYREIAPRLAAYVKEQGFTHVELLPITEHPFDGSWGYQTTGYYAPTSRHGTPQDFMFLVDTLHRHGIGVLLDWVPAHFPTDGHGLAFFDGTHLYEHEDPRLGRHKDWGTLIYNYGRNEVANFLLSNALFWLDRYHLDGLRVDAVASMLYLDYSREPGDWVPNAHGGRENLEAIAFLRRLNEKVYGLHPDVVMYAEESTAWPMVSKPTYIGGLGFGLKWDMGWMHDTLVYFRKDPIHRRYHHDQLTFRMLYAFTENFVLPLSHDEVVHGKGSLLDKMPGDLWQRFANLRLLLGNQWTQAGKKLLFMGGEFGQWREWHHDESLDWHLLQHASHQGVQRWVRDLNAFYRATPAMHEQDASPLGFEWIDCHDADSSTLSFLRWSRDHGEVVLCVFNHTPVPREGFRVGVPWGGRWDEVLNSDATLYAGSGMGNAGGVEAEPMPWHGRPWSVKIVAPPLAMVAFRSRRPA